VAGNTCQVLNTQTMKRKYLFGFDGKGMGCVAVHPSKKFFAVGEQGTNPNIYIYEFPSYKIHRVMRGGTECAFTDLNFSFKGDKLASVGNFPDFLLTVWDWKQEKITLHTKAFAQEVFNCEFSQDDDGQLVTSGVGHVRFWKMASTFTGLKLQGEIGKFGKTELSDVRAFTLLPDGKVLTGTEYGKLLLWDGNFIKYELQRPGDLKAHELEISIVRLEREEGYFISGGVDGWVRYWDFTAVDGAELGEDATSIELAPMKEFDLNALAGQPVQVKGLLKGHDHWVVQDGHGRLWKADLVTWQMTQLMHFHARAITSLCASPSEHFATTGGQDGTVRCWDYIDKKELYQIKFNSAACCSVFAPPAVDPKVRTLAVGFANGFVRVLVMCKDEFKMSGIFKPHNDDVVGVAYSPDGRLFATIGADGTLFLLKVGAAGEDYTPVGFYELNSQPNSVCWRSDSEALLVGLQDGAVVEATPPDGSADTSETFQLPESSLKRWNFKRPAKPRTVAEIEAEAAKPPALPGQEEAEEEAEDENPFANPTVPPSPVLSVVYKQGGEGFLMTMSGVDAGKVYECGWDSEDPISDYPVAGGANGAAHAGGCPMLSYASSKKLLLNGSADGLVQIRPTGAPKGFAQVNMHNGETGRITGVAMSFDDKFVLSAGMDGLFFASRVDAAGLAVEAADMHAVALQHEHEVETAKIAARVKGEAEAKKIAEANALEGATRMPVPDVHLLTELAGAQRFEAVNADEYVETGFTVALEEDLEDGAAPAEVPAALVEVPAAASKVATFNAAAELAIEVKEDITAADAYSIQDEKLKREEDNRRIAAEKKKDQVRETVKNLREEYTALKAENAKQIPERRVTAEKFDLEPEFIQSLKEVGEKECREVEKELEFATEQCELAQRKLKSRFLDDVLVELIELKALRSPYCLLSFRCAELPLELQESLHSVHTLIDSESAKKKEEEAARLEGRGPMGAGDGARGASKGDDARGAAKQAAEGKTTGHMGYEHRKQMRQARTAKLDALAKQRPSEDAEDPRDVRAIAYAEANMGDYKLKTADNYVVPEEQRVNADKKRRQMILLEEAMHKIKINFNQRVLSLRELKKQIIQQISFDNKRIRQINADLGREEELWEPLVSPGEWPERREEVSAEDLQAWKHKEAKDEDDAPAKKADAAEEEEEEEEEEEIGPADAFLDEQEARIRAAEAQGLPSYVCEALRMAPADELSELQKAEQEAHQQRMAHERDALLKKSALTVSHFDEAIYELRQEKMKLDADLKAAEMRMLTLYQELVLLKQFETKDLALAAKMDKCVSEKAAVVSEISDCQNKLATKNEEIGVWQEKEKTIMGEFHSLVGDANASAFHAQLLKVFKRKIKRAKKRTGDDEEEEEEEEDWEEDEDEDFDDDEGDEDEEDACPAGCDQTLYDKVLELREKRLDQEDIHADFQKAVDELTRNKERHTGRQKQIDKDLSNTELEIQSFQTEKQARLNELDVVVTLKLDQLLCMEPLEEPAEGEEAGPPAIMPHTVDRCLVFSRRDLLKLKNRIKELEVENKTLRQQFKDLHKEQSRLAREKKLKEAEIALSTAKCDDLQMLKFGQTIDLEALDRVSVSKTVDDLREKTRLEEAKNERELGQMKRQHNQYREAVLRGTQENTALLEKIATLSKKQFKLEKELNASGGQLHVADRGPLIKNEVEERNRLVQLVKLQAKEVDALKAEINMLRRKGGHVYTPAVGNQGA
jgi:WD40 repeat protein